MMDPLAVAATVLVTDVRTLQAERITSGLTNESWRVWNASTAVVVRMGVQDEQALQLNRRSEAAVLQAVAAAGIGAPILLCAPAQRVLVTRFLQGQVLHSESARTPAVLQRLVSLLQRLHALVIPAQVQQTDLQAVLHGYWETLSGSGCTDSAGSTCDQQRALGIAQASAAMPYRCLCHNDVHPLNLIDNGQGLWLLDWEYAGIGDPFFDLASVCCYFKLSDAQRELLLSHYRPGSSVAECSHLTAMCWLFEYISQLWLSVRNRV